MLGFGDMHKGMLRPTNQDYIHFTNDEIGMLDNLYIVADGIGGHNAGEVASKNSVVFFCDYVRENNDDVVDLMVSALCYSNNKVHDLSVTVSEFEDMGTTFTALTIKDNKLVGVHVGDSRLYILRDGVISQLTNDHTYAMELLKAGILSEEEAKVSRESHMLTRAIGSTSTIVVDTIIHDILDGDILLMCSDGLSNMVEDSKILEIISKKEMSTNDKVANLISLANENGGKDNISVIVVEI